MSEILIQFSFHITTNTVSPSRCVRTTCAWARVRARTRVSVHVDGFTQPESTLRDQPEPWDRVTRHNVGTSLSSSPRRTQFEYSKLVNKLAINHCIRSMSSLEETGYSCLGKQIIVHSNNHSEHTNTRRGLVHQQSVNILWVTQMKTTR